ncbi:hypothetical protein E0W68_04810 [Flavobacterium salilacus subsp. salilacus]|uniref:hypothetical protein n=1 Tax=Flavobacterium TaxID=237 RepID=UPI001074F334|nr:MULTISPECIES: hypothetical protein [Flavobacterium]KAF2519095.1 hypothetical protein E0W68_04810 [Flavobacterium salilacus subsp. salilacus]MBE1613272.1 hypothetical protein [Flavobacterium sp. SaA2.13]
MEKEIRTELIELARLKTPWSYSQLNEQLQLNLNFKNPLDRELIGELLGEISYHEFERGRPLLSSLIIHKGPDREQGDGFYKLCAQLYGDKTWQEYKADESFEIEEMKKCYAFWKNNDNYQKYKNDF